MQQDHGLAQSTQELSQQRHSHQQTSQHKTQLDWEAAVSNMCIECGCESVGSETGVTNIPGGILDVSRDGEAGLTLNMTATQQERTRFINE